MQAPTATGLPRQSGSPVAGAVRSVPSSVACGQLCYHPHQGLPHIPRPSPQRRPDFVPIRNRPSSLPVFRRESGRVKGAFLPDSRTPPRRGRHGTPGRGHGPNERISLISTTCSKTRSLPTAECVAVGRLRAQSVSLISPARRDIRCTSRQSLSTRSSSAYCS